MVQQLLNRVAPTQCHPQSRLYQALLAMRSHRPTDNEPRIDIQHHGQVQPALGGPDGGNIREPFPIRSRSGEIALQQIRSHQIAMATIRGTNATLLLDSTQASLPHQALHAVLATADPLGLQFGMDPWAAIDLPALLIGVADLLNRFLWMGVTLMVIGLCGAITLGLASFSG